MNWGVFLFVMLMLLFIIIIIIFVCITQEPTYSSTCESQTDCQPGYVCNESNICVAGLGQACSDTKDCLSPLICSSSSKTCVVGKFNDEMNSEFSQKEPKYVTRNIAHLYGSVESTDDEINSTGSMEDGDFDILSNESSSEKSSSITDEKIFLSEYKDACMLGSSKIYLKKDNSIVLETHDHKKRTINNNITIKRVCFFKANLYAIDVKGVLYMLDSSNVQEKYWEWSEVSWAPNKTQENDMDNAILWMSSPHDGSCLWVSTSKYGYIYRVPDRLEQTVPLGGNRRYGMDMNHFVEIKDHTCKIYPEKKTFINVKDALLTHTNTLVTIPNKAIENRVVLLDWMPAYLV